MSKLSDKLLSHHGNREPWAQEARELEARLEAAEAIVARVRAVRYEWSWDTYSDDPMYRDFDKAIEGDDDENL
jgi:hypothetical protein